MKNGLESIAGEKTREIGRRLKDMVTNNCLYVGLLSSAVTVFMSDTSYKAFTNEMPLGERIFYGGIMAFGAAYVAGISATLLKDVWKGIDSLED